jgi:hypothetical protein
MKANCGADGTEGLAHQACRTEHAARGTGSFARRDAEQDAIVWSLKKSKTKTAQRHAPNEIDLRGFWR